jgi:protein phosphatase
VRERNEDNFLVLSAPAITPEVDALFVVADGMGGHQAGDVASGYLVSRLQESFASAAFREDVHYSAEHADYFAAVLKEVLERNNEELYNLASSRPELRGMGTTATVALLAGSRLFLGHVGDSRAYLWREGALRQLTEDHSWVAEQVRDGKLSWAEAAGHPRKNVLTRSLGSSLVVRVDRAIHPLQAGDRLLLCSDGLTNYVGDAELQQALATQADVQAACEWLVALANQRGGADNITAVVVHFSPEAAPARLAAQRGAASAVQPEVAAIATTQKIVRPRPKRRWLSVQAARRLRRTLVVLLVSLLGAAAAFAGVQLGMNAAGADALPDNSDWLALLAAAAVAALLCFGIVLGLALGRLWNHSGQPAGETAPAPPTEPAASRQDAT